MTEPLRVGEALPGVLGELVDRAGHGDDRRGELVAQAGYTASSIDAAHRGVGYLLHEGGEPVRMRTFYLTDDDLTLLARRAEALREPPAKPIQLPPTAIDHGQAEGEGAA